MLIDCVVEMVADAKSEQKRQTEKSLENLQQYLRLENYLSSITRTRWQLKHSEAEKYEVFVLKLA